MRVRWRAGNKVVLLDAWLSGRRAMPLCPMAEGKRIRESRRGTRDVVGEKLDVFDALWDI